MYYFRRLLLLLLYCLAAAVLPAQTEKKKLGFIARLDSIRGARLAEGKGLFTPFIAPSFSPELGLTISAGGLYTFTFDRQDTSLLRSSIPFSAGVSTTGALTASLFTTFFFPDNRYRLYGEYWFKDQPYHYWGVGYENGRQREQTDSTTLYQRKWYRVYNRFMRRFGNSFYSGPVLDFAHTDATELSPVVARDEDLLAAGRRVGVSGLGWAFQYDSRDIVVNAYRGMLLDLNLLSYGKFLGGEFSYRVLELDYRQYRRLGEKRRVLAWQVRTRNTFGDVPWPELSLVGSPVDLRGYYWGRFRDRSTLFGLLEYRHMFSRVTPNRKGNYRSPFGFAAWVGAGTLGGGIDELFRDYIPNAGLGFRFETEPRMNVRVDVGFGLESTQFYVSFNEAF